MTTAQGHHATVNGIQLYYERHGSGEPLILLHGGLGTIAEIFGRLMPALAAHREVIAVELQGHGHTADNGRPMAASRFWRAVARLTPGYLPKLSSFSLAPKRCFNRHSFAPWAGQEGAGPRRPTA